MNGEDRKYTQIPEWTALATDQLSQIDSKDAVFISCCVVGLAKRGRGWSRQPHEAARLVQAKVVENEGSRTLRLGRVSTHLTAK